MTTRHTEHGRQLSVNISRRPSRRPPPGALRRLQRIRSTVDMTVDSAAPASGLNRRCRRRRRGSRRHPAARGALTCTRCRASPRSWPCCRRRPWSWTARTGCCGPAPRPASFGLVKGDRLVVGELLALARQVRRDGEIREGEIEVPTSKFNGRIHQLRGPGRAARGRGGRRRPGAAAGRGPDREPPGGRGPPGLRGQHQPRAEDPGRRAGAAGRDGRGRRRRPRGGAPVRRAGCARKRPG